MSEQKFLRSRGIILLLQCTAPFDPNAFYQIRKGLRVWDSFKECILPVARPIGSLPALAIASFNLTKPAPDTQIHKELPGDYVFEDASEFCAHLASMIERQPNGEVGELLQNGYANLFYVRGIKGKIFSVYVAWYSDDWEWYVGANPLDVLQSLQWGIGNRVFSSNC